jgi:hypothetical protein
MSGIDHATVVENLRIVAAISLCGGGLGGQVAGFVHRDLGFLAKLVIAAGIALIIFGSIWFFAPATGA